MDWDGLGWNGSHLDGVGLIEMDRDGLVWIGMNGMDRDGLGWIGMDWDSD